MVYKKILLLSIRVGIKLRRLKLQILKILIRQNCRVVLYFAKIYICGKVKIWEKSTKTKLTGCKYICICIYQFLRFRDFGTNYPSDWLYDGFRMTPNFNFDTKMLSYSGTRQFTSTPDFSLTTTYRDNWKITSPLFGF